MTANYPNDIVLKEKIIWFEFIRSRNMITLDINVTNMELKEIITFMNKNSNYVKNIISMVIKEG